MLPKPPSALHMTLTLSPLSHLTEEDTNPGRKALGQGHEMGRERQSLNTSGSTRGTLLPTTAPSPGSHPALVPSHQGTQGMRLTFSGFLPSFVRLGLDFCLIHYFRMTAGHEVARGPRQSCVHQQCCASIRTSEGGGDIQLKAFCFAKSTTLYNHHHFTTERAM